MAEIYNYDEEAPALCPFRDDVCLSQCMLMCPDGWGEPKCALYVIADTLVHISSNIARAIN